MRRPLVHLHMCSVPALQPLIAFVTSGMLVQLLEPHLCLLDRVRHVQQANSKGMLGQQAAWTVRQTLTLGLAIRMKLRRLV